MEVHIGSRVSWLKLRAAQKFDICPEKCHIGHVALQAMLEDPEQIHQIDGATDTQESNISVANKACRLASAMTNFGLKVGDPVIVMGYNHLNIAAPYFACHFNGHAMCTMDPSIIPGDLISLFSDVRPKLAFCPKFKLDEIKDALVKNNLEAHIVVLDETGVDLEEFIQSNNGTELNFRPAEFDQVTTIAWLMLTSGTTGKPKVAIIPFSTLLQAVCSWWSPFSGALERVLTMGTIQWLSALIFFISTPIRRFARLQSSVPLNPQLIIAIINKYRPNGTAWTPFLFGQFLQAAWNVCDLSSFRYILIGGSSIQKPLVDKFREKYLAHLYLVYGMTELLEPIFQYNEKVPFGSSGWPREHFQYRLINDEGEDVKETHQPGELWVKGDAFFKGYLNNKEETDKTISKDGWVMTGDVFYRDESDYFFYVERKRLMIKCTGRWISPTEMERVIKKHPSVTEVCVVGIPDVMKVEVPVAVIVRRNGDVIEPNEIFAVVKSSLSEVKQLHGGLLFVPSLPVTPSGKVHRAKVVEMVLSAQRIMPQ